MTPSELGAIERELTSLVGEANILSPAPETYTIDDQRPSVVVFPATPEEIAAILRLASARRLAVVPVGSGRRLSVGNPPERVDILLSTRRMTRILEYEPADLTASVEAGCHLEAFQNAARPHRQWLPFDPPEAERATLGGIVAANDFGPLRQGYGRPRDYVIGMEVVQADGTRIRAGGRVVKNVTGYDLNKLFVGSFGTLGVIVRVNFKLRPYPEAEATAVLLSSTWEPLESMARQILRSELVPAAMLLVTEGASSVLHPGWPKALLVRFLEVAPAVAYQMDRVRHLARSPLGELVELAEDASRSLWETIGRLRRHLPTDLLIRMSVLPAHTVDALRTGERLLSTYLAPLYALAQPGTGIVHIGGKLTVEGADGLSQVAHALVHLRTMWAPHSGRVLVEQAPLGIKRNLDVWGDVGSSLPLMRALKSTFDPQRILSPGRFVAGL